MELIEETLLIETMLCFSSCGVGTSCNQLKMTTDSRQRIT